MKPIYFIIFFLFSLINSNAQINEKPISDPDKAKFIVDDIDNFYNMLPILDQAKGTQDSINIIQNNYIDRASNGLKEYWETEKRNGKSIEDEYLKIIRSYPKYFLSLKSSMYELPSHFSQYSRYLERIKELYPDALFYNNYFSVGFFNTQGQMLKSRSVFVSTEAALTSTEVDYNEFSDNFSWLQEDAVSFKELGYLIVHENLHSQQKIINSEKSFLNTAIIEGAAVFLTEFICGKESLVGPAGLGTDMFETASKEGVNIWKEFAKDLSNNNSSQWFFNDNGKYPFAMGYYMGYMICKDFYENSKNKEEALNILIKVADSEFIYRNSSYYDYYRQIKAK